MIKINNETWEVIKSIPAFWTHFGTINDEEKELGVLTYINQQLEKVIVLPKFFIEQNYSTLMNYEITAQMIRDFNNQQKVVHTPLKTNFDFKFTMRDEQLPLIESVINKYKQQGFVNGVIKANPGFGKGLPKDDIIPTVLGHRKVSTIKLGDYLFGKNGKPTKVLGVFPQGLKDIYRVTFNDGTFNDCDDTHLWTVRRRTGNKNQRNVYSTISTIDLFNDKRLVGQEKTKYNTIQLKPKYDIDLCEPVEHCLYDDKDISIPPFTLGCLIGDGSFRNSAISIADKSSKNIKRIQDELDESDLDWKLVPYSKGSFRFTGMNQLNILKQLDLFNKKSIEKHIPKEYLYNNIKNRKLLLEGLMATDTYFYNKVKKNTFDYYTSSEQLKDNFLDLIEGLGINHSKVRYNPEPSYTYNGEKRIGQPAWTIFVNLDKAKRKPIIKIEKLDNQKETICFKVEADDMLFLCGNYTVTHNTVSGVKIASEIKQQTLVIVPNDILEKQWVQSIIDCTNLTEDDIGVIQGSDIASLHKKNTYTKPFIIAKVQSILSQLKTFDIDSLEELYSGIGIVFYDEVHTSGAAESYSKTSFIFKTNNIIGLTATPYLKNINDFLIHNGIGPMLYESNHQNLIADVHLHQVTINTLPQDEQKLRMLQSEYIMFLATLNKMMETQPQYFEYLTQWVLYYLQQNRKIVVLFSNNKLIEILKQHLIKAGVDCGVLIGDTNSKVKKYKKFLTQEQYDKYIKGYFLKYPKRKKAPVLKELIVTRDDLEDIIRYSLTKKQEEDVNSINDEFNLNILIEEIEPKLSDRETAGKKPVILSNFKLLSAGADFPELSVILFGSVLIGKIGVNQSIGRATRIFPGKPNPHAHFFFPHIFTKLYPTMVNILVNNIKTQFPTTKFTYENFDFQTKQLPGS